jgi:hypothetical protein
MNNLQESITRNPSGFQKWKIKWKNTMNNLQESITRNSSGFSVTKIQDRKSNE